MTDTPRRTPTTTVPGFTWDHKAGGWREDSPIEKAAALAASRKPIPRSRQTIEPTPEPETPPRPRGRPPQRTPVEIARAGGKWDPRERNWVYPHPSLPPAFVYVLRQWDIISASFNLYAKIGMAQDLRRRKSGYVTHCPQRVVCVAAFCTKAPQDMERTFHGLFKSVRLSGEWFLWTPELRAACDDPPEIIAGLISDVMTLAQVLTLADVDLSARAAEPVADAETVSRLGCKLFIPGHESTSPQ